MGGGGPERKARRSLLIPNQNKLAEEGMRSCLLVGRFRLFFAVNQKSGRRKETPPPRQHIWRLAYFISSFRSARVLRFSLAATRGALGSSWRDKLPLDVVAPPLTSSVAGLDVLQSMEASDVRGRRSGRSGRPTPRRQRNRDAANKHRSSAGISGKKVSWERVKNK